MQTVIEQHLELMHQIISVRNKVYSRKELFWLVHAVSLKK